MAIGLRCGRRYQSQQYLNSSAMSGIRGFSNPVHVIIRRDIVGGLADVEAVNASETVR